MTEKSAQDVAFNSVYVSVRDEASSALYEKLQEVYFASDKVDLEEKTAYKVLDLRSIPPVLQIQLEASSPSSFSRASSRRLTAVLEISASSIRSRDREVSHVEDRYGFKRC